MTLWANRDGQSVTIHGNTGLSVKVTNSNVTEFTVSEHAGHVRSFWGQLGRLLDEAETEARDGAAS